MRALVSMSSGCKSFTLTPEMILSVKQFSGKRLRRYAMLDFGERVVGARVCTRVRFVCASTAWFACAITTAVRTRFFMRFKDWVGSGRSRWMGGL